MKTKLKWGNNLGGWVKPFALCPKDKRDLIAWTSGRIAQRLEAATRDYISIRDWKNREPHDAELREALQRLHDWTAQGQIVLPSRDEFIGTDRFEDAIGWDPARFEAFRCDLEAIQSAARRCLLEIRPRRGSPNKGAQQFFARRVAGILRTGGFSTTSARNGVFSGALAILLSAAKEQKDIHSIVEQTIRALK